MSEALRTVFAEFGIDVDVSQLDKLEARVRDAVKTTGMLPKAAAAASNVPVAPKLKPIESYLDLLKRVDDKSAEAIGKVIGPHIDQLAQKFPPLNNALRAFGVDAKDGASIARVFTGGTLGMLHVVVQLTGALFGFANGFAAASEQLRDASADAGVTTSEFQSLSHAGVQSGVGADRLTKAVAGLHRQMQAARLTGGGVNSTLRRLGVESRTVGGGIRNASDVMNDLSVQLDRIHNPIRRDRIGVRLFGDEWYRLRGVMHGGAGGLVNLRSQMEALGGGVLPEAVEASRQYTMASGRLSIAQDSLRSVLAVGVLPALTWVTNRVAELTGWWSRMTRGTNLAQVAMVALGVAGVATAGALIVAWLPVALPFLKIALLIALVIAVLDDLVTLANGGNSVFGEMLDTLLGTGAAAQMVADLRDAWRAVVDTVKEGVDAVREFLSLRPGGGANTGPVRGYVQNAAGAPGRAAIRSRISPAALAANQRAATTQAGAAPPPYAVAPPPLRAVAAPGAGGRTTVRHTTHTNHNTFHLAGPDAHQLAGQVGEILERQAREQRDADHPQPGDDD